MNGLLAHPLHGDESSSVASIFALLVSGALIFALRWLLWLTHDAWSLSNGGGDIEFSLSPLRIYPILLLTSHWPSLSSVDSSVDNLSSDTKDQFQRKRESGRGGQLIISGQMRT